jgi:large subunit ribosomal protein L5
VLKAGTATDVPTFRLLTLQPMADAPRLQDRYQNEVRPALKDQFGYDNPMEIPSLKKICINRGIGDVSENQNILEDAVEELRKITGQHPSVQRAKKSIASFNIREGMPVGVKVTLRDARMYEFFDRLVTLALPNIRDFQGVPDRSFDGHGNYTLGIDEQIIFPEIEVDNVDRIDGMDVTFVTEAETDEEAYALLKELGMPFVRRGDEEPAAA